MPSAGLDRGARAAGVAGIVFSVLFVTALVLLRQTLGRGLSTSTVLTNVTGHGSTPALLGLYAVPFAGISFLWFIGVVRDRIGEREDRFFATVFFGSGLLFVAMMFASAAVLAGLVAGARFGTATPTDVATVGFARSVARASRRLSPCVCSDADSRWTRHGRDRAA